MSIISSSSSFLNMYYPRSGKAVRMWRVYHYSPHPFITEYKLIQYINVAFLIVSESEKPSSYIFFFFLLQSVKVSKSHKQEKICSIFLISSSQVHSHSVSLTLCRVVYLRKASSNFQMFFYSIIQFFRTKYIFSNKIKKIRLCSMQIGKNVCYRSTLA